MSEVILIKENRFSLSKSGFFDFERKFGKNMAYTIGLGYLTGFFGGGIVGLRRAVLEQLKSENKFSKLTINSMLNKTTDLSNHYGDRCGQLCEKF
jgi:hypothetical protein